jgi:hypothetical protein
LTVRRPGQQRCEVPVDERDKASDDERDDEQREARFERPLTQRELVRASLLRCPPAESAEPPRH